MWPHTSSVFISYCILQQGRNKIYTLESMAITIAAILEGSCNEWVHGIEPVLQLFVFSLQQHASVLGADGECVL